MSADGTNQSELNQSKEQAKNIAGLLDAHAQQLSMHTLQQLEDGRKLAVKKHEQRHHGHTVAHFDGTLHYFSIWATHHRLAFFGFLAISLVVIFVASQFFIGYKTSDAFLLGADLPPEAFVDRGFEPALNRVKSI